MISVNLSPPPVTFVIGVCGRMWLDSANRWTVSIPLPSLAPPTPMSTRGAVPPQQSVIPSPIILSLVKEVSSMPSCTEVTETEPSDPNDKSNEPCRETSGSSKSIPSVPDFFCVPHAERICSEAISFDLCREGRRR